MGRKTSEILELRGDPLEKRSLLFFDEFLKNLPPGSRVLDLGSGGQTFDYSNFPHLRIFSCDVNWSKGLARDEHVSYVRGSADLLPFRCETFHLIIANFVFEHFTKPTNALVECERVTNARGFFYAAIPNARGIEDRCYRIWRGRKDHIQTYTFHHFLRLVYCHTSFKLNSFCDYPAGFTWFEALKRSPMLMRGFATFLKGVKYFNADALRSCNFLLAFRKGDLKGYRFLSHNCIHCGVAVALPPGYESKHWQCEVCGKSNPML
jgi:SAM-dependent methyltransferase